jgi:hypothetical protein
MAGPEPDIRADSAKKVGRLGRVRPRRCGEGGGSTRQPPQGACGTILPSAAAAIRRPDVATNAGRTGKHEARPSFVSVPASQPRPRRQPLKAQGAPPHGRPARLALELVEQGPPRSAASGHEGEHAGAVRQLDLDLGQADEQPRPHNPGTPQRPERPRPRPLRARTAAQDRPAALDSPALVPGEGSCRPASAGPRGRRSPGPAGGAAARGPLTRPDAGACGARRGMAQPARRAPDGRSPRPPPARAGERARGEVRVSRVCPLSLPRSEGDCARRAWTWAGLARRGTASGVAGGSRVRTVMAISAGLPRASGRR